MKAENNCFSFTFREQVSIHNHEHSLFPNLPWTVTDPENPERPNTSIAEADKLRNLNSIARRGGSLHPNTAVMFSRNFEINDNEELKPSYFRTTGLVRPVILVLTRSQTGENWTYDCNPVVQTPLDPTQDDLDEWKSSQPITRELF